MIGALGRMFVNFVQSNPGLAGHIASRAGNAAIKSISRKRKAKKECLIEIEKKKEKLFKIAVSTEMERFLSENPRAKDFEEDVLWDFAKNRLIEHLPQRIVEYEAQLAQVHTAASELAEQQESLEVQLACIADESAKDKRQMSTYKKKLNKAKRLNEFYVAYVSACNAYGINDDIAKLQIMTSAKKFDVTAAELRAVEKFAESNGFDTDVTYVPEPTEPKRRTKKKSGENVSARISALKKNRKKMEKDCEQLQDIICILKDYAEEHGMELEDHGCEESVDETSGPECEEMGCDDEVYDQDETHCVSDDEGSGVESTNSRTGSDVILEAFENCRDIESLFIGQDIPDDKLSNAAESMQIKENVVAVLWDTTVFGSAKDGMLVTEEAVYFKNLWENPKRLTWKRILKLKNTGGGEFTSGGYTFNASDEDAANRVYEALLMIAQQLAS